MKVEPCEIIRFYVPTAANPRAVVNVLRGGYTKWLGHGVWTAQGQVVQEAVEIYEWVRSGNVMPTVDIHQIMRIVAFQYMRDNPREQEFLAMRVSPSPFCVTLNRKDLE